MGLMNGKVCVVTGGAAGIGRCLVETFAHLGADVYFIDKNKQAGEQLLDQLAPTKGNHVFVHGDLAEESDIQGFANKVLDSEREIYTLVNNACFNHGGILDDCSFERFNEVLHVGVTAPFMLAKLFLPRFCQDASIVNISSTRAMQSQANTESYSAAKGAILSLTHALSVSLAGRVRVNAISPGWIDTGATDYMPNEADILQHPSHRIGKPDDIARVVLFLINSENSFINGENIVVDGGMSRLMVYHGDAGWKFSNSN